MRKKKTPVSAMDTVRPEFCFFFFIHSDIEYLLSFKEIVAEQKTDTDDYLFIFQRHLKIKRLPK